MLHEPAKIQELRFGITVRTLCQLIDQVFKIAGDLARSGIARGELIAHPVEPPGNPARDVTQRVVLRVAPHLFVMRNDVINSFEQLMQATAPDFTPIYAQLASRDSIPAGEVLATDPVFHRGSGEGWLNDGDV